MVGQARSTLDLRQAITGGKILLVNTAASEIGVDVGGFLGAVILNHLSAVIREQIALPPEQQRDSVHTLAGRVGLGTHQ